MGEKSIHWPIILQKQQNRLWCSGSQTSPKPFLIYMQILRTPNKALFKLGTAALWGSNLCLTVSSSSANGATSGGPSTLVPQLLFVSQAMFSGQCWQLTCSMQPSQFWWPCGFRATPTSSSKLLPFLVRQVCQIVRRKTPSTKINNSSANSVFNG